MAAIFAYPELHAYVVDKLAENVGSFLSCFLDACQRVREFPEVPSAL